MVSNGDSAFVARLLSIADGSQDETADRLAGEDQDGVADALLSEVAARAALHAGPAMPILLQLDLGAAAKRLNYLVRLDNGKVDVSRGWSDEADALVRQDLGELLRAVFGRPADKSHVTREILVNPRQEPTWAPDDTWPQWRDAVTAALWQYDQGCTATSASLSSLAVRFGSDKWGGHWYTPHYERHFAPLRERRVKVLEIGIGGYYGATEGGGSLRMWKHFFPRGLVYGLDIFDKSPLAESRMATIEGDQGDAGYLDGLAREIGPLDIVIDDGSHMNEHVAISFATLFPYVRPGGLYVIEDMQTSYWPGYGGTSTDLSTAHTSTGLVKTLVDGLHHQEQMRDESIEPSVTELGVTAIHTYHNIVFIEKGLNTEQSAPAWVSRTKNPMEGWDDWRQE